MPTNLTPLRSAGITATLRSCQLFFGLPAPELEAIAGFSTLRSVPKGGYLFYEGAPSEGFYVVVSGSICIHRVNAAGKEQVIHVFRPGESFAEGTVATSTGYPADARAVDSDWR